MTPAQAKRRDGLAILEAEACSDKKYPMMWDYTEPAVFSRGYDACHADMLSDKYGGRFIPCRGCPTVECTCSTELEDELLEKCCTALKDISDMLPVLEQMAEALEMGAFHFSACQANYYSEETKENWNGVGEHRKARPCTCSHKKVDDALAAYHAWRGEK